MIKYWLKIVRQSSNPLVYKAYSMLYRSAEQNATVVNWASQMKTLLNSLGFGHAWLYQGVVNSSAFLRLVEQRLCDNYQQQWNQTVRNSSEGFIYKELKTTFQYSKQLSLMDQPKYRYQFVKFITRNHNLAVVTGSWHKPRPIPYGDRRCQLCNLIEDEFHVVLQCKKFYTIRKRYIPECFWRRPSMHTFLSLMSTTDVTTLHNLAIYLYKVFHVH